MAQIVEVGLSGSKGDEFVNTGVDAAWTELVNVDSLKLWEVLEGETITGYIGSYTTGGGMIRIYNTQTKEVKLMALLNILTEEEFVELDAPIYIEKHDVIHVRTLAVG